MRSVLGPGRQHEQLSPVLLGHELGPRNGLAGLDRLCLRDLTGQLDKCFGTLILKYDQPFGDEQYVFFLADDHISVGRITRTQLHSFEGVQFDLHLEQLGIVTLNGLWGNAAQFAGEKLKALINGEPVHADIVKSVMQVGALNGNDATYTWLRERFESSASEHERMNILAAFGCFSDRELIEKSLQYSVDEVPDRNKFIPIVAMSSNPHAVDSMWDWYVAHLSELEQFHPLLYERVIAAIVPVGGIGDSDRVKAFFEKYIQEQPQTTEVVKLSLEKLEINLRMRERLRR